MSQRGLLRKGRKLCWRIEIKIRPAHSSDSSVITEFNLRLAQETEGLELDRACLETGVKELLKDPAKGLYYVAEVEGTVVGQVMITYEWSDWRNGNLWWLQSVYVQQDYRQRGVFSALFRHIEKLARSRPEVCGLRLYMHADNARARRSYQRLGMNPTQYLVFDKTLRQGTEEHSRGADAHAHD